MSGVRARVPAERRQDMAVAVPRARAMPCTSPLHPVPLRTGCRVLRHNLVKRERGTRGHLNHADTAAPVNSHPPACVRCSSGGGRQEHVNAVAVPTMHSCSGSNLSVAAASKPHRRCHHPTPFTNCVLRAGAVPEWS